MGGFRWGRWLGALCVLAACGSISEPEAVQKGCETSCKFRLECRFESPAGVPACAMACPDTAAAASSECRSAYAALGRCVSERTGVECPGFLAGFCGDQMDRVRTLCDGEILDAGMTDGAVADAAMVDDAAMPTDMGQPPDASDDMTACVPDSCETLGAECGTVANSCGGAPLDCPSCEGGRSCDGNTCVGECVPNANEMGQAAMAVSAGAGDNAWAMPAGARMTADGLSASVTLRFSEPSQDLRLTDWGFALPVGATVEGVEVGVIRSATGNTVDDAIQLIAGGDPAGTAKTVAGNWPSAPANETYGNSADGWGATLSRDVVNAADFGVLVRARHTGGAPSNSSIEFVSMVVYYSNDCP